MSRPNSKSNEKITTRFENDTVYHTSELGGTIKHSEDEWCSSCDNMSESKANEYTDEEQKILDHTMEAVKMEGFVMDPNAFTTPHTWVQGSAGADDIYCRVCGVSKSIESIASLKAMKASGAGDMIDDIPDGMDLDEWLRESKASESTWHIEIEDFSRDSGKNTYDLTLGSQATEEDVKEKIIGMYTDAGFQYSREDVNDPLVTKITKTGESKASESVTIDDFKRIKDNLLAEKLNFEQGSALVDIQTANAIVAVWDNINEEQRLKFPLHLTSAHNVARLAGIAFKSSERLARDDEETYTGYYSRPKGAVPQTGNCPDCGHDVGQHSGASTGDTICYGGGNCDCGRTFPYIKESKAGESISDSDKQILGDWVSQNRDWTTIDDLPNEIFIPLMAPFGDDTDKRVEAQVEIINYMKSLGESDMVSESWSQKSSINRIEALERIGVKQGDAIKLSSLEFEDFGEDLQGALKGDVEDARKKMKAQKAFLDKDEDNLADITTSTGDIQKFSGFKNQQGGEVENPNSEFQQSYPDYNNIGESQTNMTSYECQYCDDGFKSNEALSIHHNDKHAISPESFDGYATETEYAMGNYTDWFMLWDEHEENVKPDTMGCDYCFDQFNVEDKQGMINHINSKHDAGVDPVTGDTGKSWGESKASEDYFEDEDGNLSSVMKWKLVYDDGSDYGFQTDSKAEAQRAVDQWNHEKLYSDRSIKIVSQESKASEFNIGTTMICPICKKEIETGNEDSFYHDSNFYDANSVPMSHKMQNHFEQEHTPEDFGVQNKNFKGASDGYEAFEDWKTGNQLSLAFRNSFPEYNQDDSTMMNNADKHSTLDSDGNRMPDDYEGESKASEDWKDDGDKYNRDLDEIRDKAYDYVENNLSKFNLTEKDVDDWHNGNGFNGRYENTVNRVIDDMTYRLEKPLYESKASEAGLEDHSCPECGFITSDNSEYLDHLNSHEE